MLFTVLRVDPLPAQSFSGRTLPGGGLSIRHGAPVPPEVRTIYEGGLRFLADTQLEDGSWQSQYSSGPGIVALCCLAFLSQGDDANFGRYAEPIHRALRYIVKSQDPSTGFISQNQGGHGSMYEHGFATLTLAEAYGAVDEVLLWAGAEASAERRTLGQALELAVRASLGSQEANPFSAWRYSPTAKDADTSVSGAILVSLLAARNAGIEIADEKIDKALQYYENSTLPSGDVSYSGGMGGGQSMARTAISCLVFAIAKRKTSEPHQATLKNLVDNVDQDSHMGHPYYTRYYVAQALFQGDFDAWSRWNERTTGLVLEEQGDDGVIGGDAYSTSMSLLALALNFRFLPIYER